MNQSVLDAAEAYVFEQVKQKVAEQVREKLLDQFNEMIQGELNRILPEIVLQMYTEKDIMLRSDNVQVMLEWIRCREEKKRFRTKTSIIEEKP